jgi:hypothetical protein
MPKLNIEDTRIEELEAENEALRDALAETEQKAVALANELMQMKMQGNPRGAPPALFLIILAVVLAGRMALYVFVEHMGLTARTEGWMANAVFGAAALFLLWGWVTVEWRTRGLLVIAKGTLLAVALAIAASEFSQNPVPVAFAVGLVVLLNASFLLDLGVTSLVKVLGGRR